MSGMSAGTRDGLTFFGVPGRMTRRLAGVVIGTQGLAVFFGALVARALAAAKGSDGSGSFLLLGSLLAVLCLLDAGLLRQPWGITVGWVLQVATLACAFVVPLMLIVGLLFGGLWLAALVQGHAMDEHTRQVDAAWYDAQQASGQPGAADGTPAKDISGPEASAGEPPRADG
jgi:hypothetical protein